MTGETAKRLQRDLALERGCSGDSLSVEAEAMNSAARLARVPYTGMSSQRAQQAILTFKTSRTSYPRTQREGVGFANLVNTLSSRNPSPSHLSFHSSTSTSNSAINEQATLPAVAGSAQSATPSRPVSGETTETARSKLSLIASLQDSIRGLESASRADDDGPLIRSGCAAMDFTLPDGGYRRGTLIEWIATSPSSGGSGIDFLSLQTAWNACQDGGALVIVDPLSQFYPPAATAMGIQFANTILLRPGASDPNELYWAIDQALRCEAVGAVWGAVDTIGERWFRRFQLSAESSGAIGVFVRPSAAFHAPSWSEVQWLLKPRTSDNTTNARVCELKLHRCRGGQTGGRVRVEIDTVTGEIRGHRIPVSHRLPTPQQNSERSTDKSQEGTCHGKMPLRSSAQLAHSATHRRSARA